MKKIYLILTLVLVLLTSCGQTVAEEEDDGKISVVTTTKPTYDWIMAVVGDSENVEVTNLIGDGVDVHSYSPSVDDMITVGTADLFVYVGGVSDLWVTDALDNAVNEDMKIINLLEVLGDNKKLEEVVEGMQEEDEGLEYEEEHASEYDEHVWLSLRNAQIFVTEIANELSLIDPVNKDKYIANSTEYNKRLADLDVKYEEMVANASKNTLLFGDRFPFRYLFDDYGISYYAAFAGCSAETEASFETIAFLSNKMDELSLNYIIKLENSSPKIAETIISNTENKTAQIIEMDSMQSTVENEQEYIEVMEKNFEAIKTALE